ncbi:glycosyltransferase [Engelhardtia mirabilis]|uniref:Glycosyl transferases group 1 n=1 Tax=Engelhardtia mirabilis TaxID=2528011 RepID=A0A518BIP6_9BACT|nr:Glycosyl transferases group 1 [Planctomycetes bacterium Pla133]QDV01160.1 Glycosyl transferases group 1 [Planctomycetes bacterium Pla86]
MRVTAEADPGQLDLGAFDLVIVLHLRRGAALLRAVADLPHRPHLIGAVSGTDLYLEPGIDAELVAECDALVTLQAESRRALPAGLQARTRVILQSAASPQVHPTPRDDVFEVCVLAHLRAVKDPLLPAKASELLPESSRIRILHAGAVLDPGLGKRAAELSRDLPRWSWLGALDRGAAAELLGHSKVCLVPSLAEGGAAVLTEAIVAGVAVVASRVPGNVGVLGEDHPGLFPAGDAEALASILSRAENDGAFLEHLRARSRELAPRFAPPVERQAWRELLEDLERSPS